MVLSDRVKEYIFEAILNRNLKPGDRIMETALARRLGISTAPVREAIRELTVMGFLQTQPYKGASVRSFSEEELWESYTVRAALESMAARLATLRMTVENIASLRSILDEMIEALEQGDEVNEIRLDNRFHETLVQFSGNRLLHQVWKTLEFGRWTMLTYRMN